jgi:uncharacterized coiled-coil protein SlyX
MVLGNEVKPIRERIQRQIDIDTCGFPFISGIPQKIYWSLKMPENHDDLNGMLTELWYRIEDIKYQLSLYNESIKDAPEKEDGEWRGSAIAKLRLSKSQYLILSRLKHLWKKEKKEDVEGGSKLEEINNALCKIRNRFRNIETRIEQVTDTEEKILKCENRLKYLETKMQHITDTGKKLKCENRTLRDSNESLRRVVNRLLFELNNHTLDDYLFESEFFLLRICLQ